MKLKSIYILPVVIALALVAGLAVLLPEAWQPVLEDLGELVTPTDAQETQAPTQAPTEAPTTEPQPQVFTLTFVGDCTLGCVSAGWNNPNGFVQTVGDNYDYPLANVAEILNNDDFTLANLEGPLTEGGTPAQKEFAFRGPTAYTAILQGVEAVSLANNHAMDFALPGLQETASVLKDAGIRYASWSSNCLMTTSSGLVVRVACRLSRWKPSTRA